ncbi:toll-interacting protein B-like isoform X1 [Argiope bruennichi]|uniref:toll-interacting protein B-like isoform X1 n=2 Tax=Argiope bruennichi TaxID=94029 RepID=UPI00249558E3|nr:toll-interacting protein B-like isoform X1 [Argiope bruennichi]
MTTPRYIEQRNRVMLGSLPEDFLRVESADSRDGTTNAHSQTRQGTQHQQNYAQANMATQITLGVVGAQLAKNYSITKMDPYVRVRIGHAVFETQTDVRGGKFPSWNKTITAYLPHGIRTIHIEIFDENTLIPDERIAYADYVLTDEALQGKFVDTWVPLSGKQGEGKEGSINITIYIRSVPYWSSVMPAAAPLMVIPQPSLGVWPYYVGGQPISICPQPVQNPNYPAPVQPPQPNYQPSEDDIKQMQEMFPSYDREVILGVLENHRGNKDQAITSLLSLGDK